MFPVQDLKGLGYEKGKPVGLVGVTELSDAQKKQLKEQQEVRPGSTRFHGSWHWAVPATRCSGHRVSGEASGQSGPPSMTCQPPRSFPSLQLDPKFRLPFTGLSSPKAIIPQLLYMVLMDIPTQ